MMNEYENVSSIQEAGVKVYGAERRETKPPFKFRVGDSPVVTVYAPDSGTVMDIEEAQSTRRVLRLFLGDEYAKVEEFLEGTDPEDMVEMARDLSRHFGLFDTQASVNRAQRRRSNRRG